MRVAERGAVIAETALTVGVGLTILLFSIQVGILGFLQVTSDAAAFVDAHGVAIGSADPLGAQHQTLSMFPQLAASDVVSTPLPAPTATYPVDYGFNGSASERSATTSRHGGASMIVPLLQQTTVTPHGTEKYLSKVLSVSGQAIEPLYLECGPHYDVAQSAVQCGSPGQPANYAVNYFTQGENTPPYYLSFNYRLRCNINWPWSNCSNAFSGGTYMAFGVAEYLDGNNWGASSPGATGTGTVSGGKPVSTFEFMGCHQRVYIGLTNFFANYPTLQSLYTAFGTAINGDIAYGKNNDLSWNEFNTNFPHQESATDDLIRQTYAWDAAVPIGATINAGTEANVRPLNPGFGC